MNDPPTTSYNLTGVDRFSILFMGAIELVTVGGLAIYAAYNDYWQLVVGACAYLLYVVFKARYDLRKLRAQAAAESESRQIGESPHGAAAVIPANWRSDFKWIKSAPHQRKLAGVLALVYLALMALAFYLESIHIEDRWPVWLLWVGGVVGFATLLILPFAVVILFFGIDITFPFLRRFTIRAMLRGMFWASLLFWYSTQMYWVIQRQQWRIANRATIISTEGQAPPALRLLREPGESRIELKNATQEQMAEAKRLFPEATVVATDNSPTVAPPNPPGAKAQP